MLYFVYQNVSHLSTPLDYFGDIWHYQMQPFNSYGAGADTRFRKRGGPGNC